MKNEKFYYKSIRDPLYGFINLSELEIGLIDTEVFRRLHYIKQLSHTFLVYPTAIHTRFEHSLGVVYLADLVCNQFDFNEDEREIIRLAALLHDLGHGPFSHLFEKVMKKYNPDINHEQISILMIEYDSNISELLEQRARPITQLLKKEKIDGWELPKSNLASDIVSGPLDVDKMDYLRRDSYHIGVKYGEFDLHRIIHTLTSTEDEENRLCIKNKGRDAVESYRLGRYLMHAQVYNHHTRLSADQMFLRAMNLAFEEGVFSDQLKLNVSNSRTIKKFLEYYTKLTDESIYSKVIETSKNEEVKRILKNIQQRKLLKPFGTSPQLDIIDINHRNIILKLDENKLESIANELAEYAELNKNDVIAYSVDIPVGLYGKEDKLFDDVFIKYEGKTRSLNELSPFQPKPNKQNKFYVFVPKNADKLVIRRFFEDKYNFQFNS